MADNPYAPPVDEPPAPALPEVRRCPGCGQPAMVCLRNFERTSLFGLVRGGPSGIRDFVCQECGRAVTLHPIPWITLPLAVMGVPLALFGAALGCSGLFSGEVLLALVVGGLLTSFGLVLTGTFSWPIWLLLRHPVAPGVLPLVLRYTEVNPPRRCSCGGEAACVSVTATRTNGIYSGTEYAYACPTCGRQFHVDSPLQLVFHGVAFAALVGMSGLCASKGWTQRDWAALGVAALLLAFGAFASFLAVSRGVARFRYPLVARRPPVIR